MLELSQLAVGSVTVFVVAYAYLSRAQKSSDAPTKKLMRRLVVTEANKDLTKVKMEVEEIPIPVPKSGQVLVKVAAVPINPSDYNIWKTQTGPMGFEGSGTVVASGGGIPGGLLVGRRVGICVQTYSCAEYIVVDALRGVFSLPDSVNLVDAASWFINPFTVLSILDVVTNRHKAKAFVHTGASSQLGQMMVKLSLQKNIQVVNLVRRKAHVDLLEKLGAQHIICQADEDWRDQLAKKIKELKITVAFDAVGGDVTGTILTRLPKKGTCYVYGVLSGKPIGMVEPIDLIYRKKQLKGHHLTISWLLQGNPLQMMYRMVDCTKQVGCALSGDGWAASSYKDTSMENMSREFTKLCEDGFTGQKLRIRMDL